MALLLALVTFGAQAAVDRPLVRDYGVKTCEQYLVSARAADEGEEAALGEQLRYRAWLGGLTTGLSFATGLDVYKGVELEGALRRIRQFCEDNPDKDFFTAAMELVKTLSVLP